MKLFDYINSINNKTYSPPSNDDKDYSQYMVERFFMHFPDTIYLANEINGRDLSKKMHYDFFYHIIPKRKRFTQWYKEGNNASLKTVMEYYECNEEKAKDYIKVLEDNDIQRMSNELMKGKIHE